MPGPPRAYVNTAAQAVDPHTGQPSSRPFRGGQGPSVRRATAVGGSAVRLHNHAAHCLYVRDGLVTEWWMVQALPAESEAFWSS